jgi:hypothetical protein
MLNNSNQVALMLMNKLAEEKRYAEALKVGKHFLKFFKISRNSNPAKVFSTIPFYNLLTECLLEMVLNYFEIYERKHFKTKMIFYS